MSQHQPQPLYLSYPKLECRVHGLRILGVLSETDVLVVDAVAPRFGETDVDVLMGLALAVRAPRAGHIGVNLRTIEAQAIDERLEPEELPANFERATAWPDDPEVWERAVLASPMVGGPDDVHRPFVQQPTRDGTLILTRRMWREQERLANALSSLAESAPHLVLDDDVIERGIQRLFPDPSESIAAVRTAAKRRLTVVTGGPGTGKTFSVKRILALLMEAASEDQPLRIELAAPTGKAAVRMAEAIAEDLQKLPTEPAIREQLSSLNPRTLHKLLGLRPDGYCHFGTERRLPADLVIVDEASMVDITLFRQLCEAIPDGARLILLGDRDQLASVEAGTVLADIVSEVLDGGPGQSRTLSQAIVPFRTNHRSAKAPTVAAIAKSIQDKAPGMPTEVSAWMTGAVSVAEEKESKRVQSFGAPDDRGRPTKGQVERLAEPYLEADDYLGLLCAQLRQHSEKSSELKDADLHRKLLKAFERYRVLAVHRKGPLGVRGLNREFTSLAQEQLKDAIRMRRKASAGAPVELPRRLGYWIGQPIIIMRNAYEVGLMNGDIGLILPGQGGLVAVFPTSDKGIKDSRQVGLGRLPDNDTAFCMTIHKSQGSQFKRVAMVLAGRESPIQTRELIYTGITRTSDKLDWLGSKEELARDLDRPVSRASGLAALLWGE